MNKEEAEKILKWHARFSTNVSDVMHDHEFMTALKYYFNENFCPLKIKLDFTDKIEK